MENPFDLVVTLELGERRRVLTAREIAHALGDPGLAVRLVALAVGAAASVGQLPGPSPDEAIRVTRNAFQETNSTRTHNATPNAPGARDLIDLEPERVAGYLASALRDEKSIAFFQVVTRSVPREVVSDALERALNARNIRKSRGALFAHIVRPYLPRSSTNPRTP